jgi:hypothetical protein
MIKSIPKLRTLHKPHDVRRQSMAWHHLYSAIYNDDLTLQDSSYANLCPYLNFRHYYRLWYAEAK